MNRRHTLNGNSQRGSAGFTLIEILIVIAIGFALMAIAIPSGLRAYRTYDLDSAASQVAGSLKFTRMQAIRLNTPIDFRSRVLGSGNTQIWTDSSVPLNDGIFEPSENQALLTPSGNLVAIAGVPNTAAIAAAIGGGALTGVAPAAGLIAFDQRGAVAPGAGGPAIYAICIQNTSVRTAGYRAIIVLQSGAIEIWAADSGGNWHQTS